MPALNMGLPVGVPIRAPATLLLIQLSTTVPGKAVNCALSICNPAASVGAHDGVAGSWLQ